MIQPVEQDSSSRSAPTVPNRPRVVICEDDLEMRRLLAECLARDGYEIVEALDGAALVERLESSRCTDLSVDLLITDLRMPVVGGFEAIERFRALGCRAPVIAITAFGDHRTHLEAVRLGVVRVFDKPFDFDDLRQVVRDLFTPRPRYRGVE